MAKQPIVEGQTATNHDTGERIIYRGGKWYPLDRDPGGAGVASAPDAPMAPLTPGSESRTRVALGLGPAIQAQKQFYQSEGWKPPVDGAPGSATMGSNPFNNDWGARVLESIPFDNGAIARAVGGQDYQSYEQASKSFESAFLPILSGAAVTPSEAQRMIRANLPQINDTPEMLATKARNRAMMINAAADLAGKPRPFPKVGIMDMTGGPTSGAPAPATAATTTPARPRVAPEAAMRRQQALKAAGRLDLTRPRGSQTNPYIAKDQATADRLPKGSYVIMPDGSLGVVE